MRLRLAIILLGLSLAHPAFSAEEGAADAPQRHVLFGTCELTADPATPEGRDALLFNLCFKGSLGSEITNVSGTPEENSWLRYAHAYGGVFLTPLLSFQARGSLRDILPLGAAVQERDDLHTDYAVFQVGNPVLNPVRLTVGHMRLPFGLDLTQASEFYQSFDNRAFWASPENGAYLTFDDMRTMKLEIGYGSGSVLYDKRTGLPSVKDGRLRTSSGQPPPDHGTSARYSLDLPALEGTRLVLSAYTGANERRMGGGIITTSSYGDATEFEWVRRLVRGEPWTQLLRLGYVGAYHGGNRWIVQIDDERFRYRRGTLECDVRVVGPLILKLAVSYFRSQPDAGMSRWYVTSGVEASL